MGGRLDQSLSPPVISKIDLGEVLFDQSRQDWDVIEPSMVLSDESRNQFNTSDSLQCRVIVGKR